MDVRKPLTDSPALEIASIPVSVVTGIACCSQLPHRGSRALNDRPHEVPAEDATRTIDRRRIDRPSPRAPAPGADEVLRRMRRRASWLRLQARICVVLVAVLL